MVNNPPPFIPLPIRNREGDRGGGSVNIKGIYIKNAD